MVEEPDFEEMEHIPWAALAASRPNQGMRMAALVGGVIVVLMLCVAVARVLLTDTDADAIIAEPVVVAAAAPLATEPGEEGLEADVAEVPTYSEADLMLIDTEDETLLAVAHAAWLVRDFLTVDGESVVSERIVELMPGANPSSGEEAVATYVEWVEPFAVSSPTPGTYRVEVLYRLLVDEGTGFARQPAEAIVVDIAVDVDGSARLLSIPDSVPVPVLHGIEVTPG